MEPWGFRELHVKTDAFCAAGITLPDKWGRMLNIGGWNTYALYGMRIFKPSGTPGVFGNTDWIEDPNNPNFVLQRSRWYPSAVMMPDGEIVVIGGLSDMGILLP